MGIFLIKFINLFHVKDIVKSDYKSAKYLYEYNVQLHCFFGFNIVLIFLALF